MSDEWIYERAWSVVTRHEGGVHDQHVKALVKSIAAFGQEAIERGENRLLNRLREPDEAMVEAVARALWRLSCSRADAFERREGRTPPAQWADPWHESGCGVRQQKSYIETADEALRALARHLTAGENSE